MFIALQHFSKMRIANLGEAKARRALFWSGASTNQGNKRNLQRRVEKAAWLVESKPSRAFRAALRLAR